MDLGCAFFVLSTDVDPAERVLFFLLYNFFAFALQMPLGLVADRLNRNKAVAAAGLIMVAASPLFFNIPLALAVAAGIGNALFHVGGGLDILNESVEKSSKLGVFVSSGALGLYLGGLLKNAIPLWFVSLALIGMAVLVFFLCGGNRSENIPLEPVKLPRFGIAAVVLLLVVVILRSYLGVTASFEWKTGLWGFISVLAVVLGKAAGGFICDRFGAKATTIASLGLAAVLFLFSASPLLGVFALFFFNMTMPITLWAVARLLKSAKGFSFGLLTFGLFIGILPIMLGLPTPLNSPWGLSVLTLISLPLLFFGLIREARNG